MDRTSSATLPTVGADQQYFLARYVKLSQAHFSLQGDQYRDR